MDDNIWSQVADNIIIDENSTFLEFGVASGNTMYYMLKNLYAKNMKPKTIIGFDSFVGLPEEDIDTYKDKAWNIGAFNIVNEMQNNSLIYNKPKDTNEAIEILKQRFIEYKETDIKFIKGFYEDTLKESYDIKPACFIHIDCDLYISSIQALDFLVKNKLFANNCIIRYDDWVVDNKSVFTCGESKAHKEICEKYNIKFEQLNSSRCAIMFKYLGTNKE